MSEVWWWCTVLQDARQYDLVMKVLQAYSDIFGVAIHHIDVMIPYDTEYSFDRGAGKKCLPNELLCFQVAIPFCQLPDPYLNSFGWPH